MEIEGNFAYLTPHEQNESSLPSPIDLTTFDLTSHRDQLVTDYEKIRSLQEENRIRQADDKSLHSECAKIVNMLDRYIRKKELLDELAQHIPNRTVERLGEVTIDQIEDYLKDK